MATDHALAAELPFVTGVMELAAGFTPHREFRNTVTAWIRRELARRRVGPADIEAADTAEAYALFIGEMGLGRLSTLVDYARTGRVAGALRQAVRWFITERLRQRDPVGHCVYKKALDGLELAAQEGIVVLDPREAGVHRACIPHATSVHEDPRRVQDCIAEAWAQVEGERALLPALSPGGYGAADAMKRLAAALRDLRAPRVLVGDLIAWIQKRVRACLDRCGRLEAGAEIAWVRDPDAREQRPARQGTRDLAVPAPESAMIASADVDAVVRAFEECVRRRAARAEIAERRARVLAAWIDAVLRDEDAGARAIAARLGLARATVHDDLVALHEAGRDLAEMLG